MGGYGSSRWSSSHRRKYTVEESLPLDVWRLGRDGLIGGPSRHGTLVWSIASGPRKGEQTATVGYQWHRHPDGNGGTLQLDYNANGMPVDDALVIVASEGNAGRQWFCLCPDCDRRVRKLFMPPGETHFHCRTCGGLTYRSSQESRHHQALYRLLARNIGTTPEAVRRAMKPKRRH
ncbi:MAG: hypothetical protein AB7K09_16145 [Planctomycetota bacterium]